MRLAGLKVAAYLARPDAMWNLMRWIYECLPLPER